jgi:hypothetical protein
VEFVLAKDVDEFNALVLVLAIFFPASFKASMDISLAPDFVVARRNTPDVLPRYSSRKTGATATDFPMAWKGSLWIPETGGSA